MKHIIFAIFALILPSILAAQSFPDYESTTVNDFAGLLSDEDEAVLDAALGALKTETGIEMVVVTLSRQDVFAPNVEFETFATGLFNHWGVGEASTNSGIMVLVMRTDRVMRVELGSGFGSGWNAVAQRSIDQAFLPEFKKDNYAAGILRGVDDVIENIARPFASGQPVPKAKDSRKSGDLLGIGVAVMAFLGFFLIGPIRRRFQRCPSCNTRGSLKVQRDTLQSATRSRGGRQKVTTTCDSCNYHDESERTTSRITSTSSSSSSFGGGGSSGGGASGKW